MPPTILSQYMSLELPVINVTPDPIWAQNFLDDLSIIDLHDHTPGKGVQVPVAGININANLNFNNFSPTNLTSAAFIAQSPVLTTPSAIYTHSGDLWYTNSSGVAVQITSGSGVNVSGVGGFQGDYITAAAIAYFNNTANLFYYTNSSGVFSSIQGGALELTNLTSNTITIQPSSSLASNYTLTLPVSLPAPGTTNILTLSSSGVLAPSLITTALVASGAITTAKIANLAITNAQIANGTITTTQIASNTITPTNLAALNLVTSGPISNVTTSSTLTATGLSVTLTTTGRPVMIMLVPGSAAYSSLGSNANSAGNNASASFAIYKNGSATWGFALGVNSSYFANAAPTINVPVSSICTIDTAASAGSNTYALYYTTGASNNTVYLNNATLIAYEIM